MKLIHEQIQYVEFLSKDLNTAKKFYSGVFGWKFTDFGPEYTAFEGKYVDGGFALGVPKQGSILPVLYSSNLESTLEKVKQNEGEVTKDIFTFPGGQRFHFKDPDGNVLAVWSET